MTFASSDSNELLVQEAARRFAPLIRFNQERWHLVQ